VQQKHFIFFQKGMLGPFHATFFLGRALAMAALASHHPSHALRPERPWKKFNSPLHLA
jgi:hypothetical protein